MLPQEGAVPVLNYGDAGPIRSGRRRARIEPEPEPLPAAPRTSNSP